MTFFDIFQKLAFLSNIWYNKEIPIKGVDFALNGTTVEGGVHFYQQDSLVTDVSGKATSDIIKRSGDLYYTITTNSVPLGYKKAEDKTIKVNKNLKTENLTLLENKNEDVNVTIDNINKIVKVTVYFPTLLVLILSVITTFISLS